MKGFSASMKGFTGATSTPEAVRVGGSFTGVWIEQGSCLGVFRAGCLFSSVRFRLRAMGATGFDITKKGLPFVVCPSSQKEVSFLVSTRTLLPFSVLQGFSREFF